MNERIKALKRQAEDYAGKYSVKHQVFGQALIDALDQKFAELIVTECIEALRLVPYHSLDIDFDEEVIYQDAIRKHFGVES